MRADRVTSLLLAGDNRNTVLATSGRARLNPLSYTPYGAQSAPGLVENRLGFNGQLLEQPAGWYHLGNGHRVYSPVLMRFHTPDRLSPFGKGGLNAYAYCGGDPVNHVDPTGGFYGLFGAFASLAAGIGAARFVYKTYKLHRANPVKFPLKGRMWVATVFMGFGAPFTVASAVAALSGNTAEALVLGGIGSLLSAPAVWLRGSVLGKKALLEKKPSVPYSFDFRLPGDTRPANRAVAEALIGYPAGSTATAAIVRGRRKST